MYTRRDVCALTGLSEAQFKNLARRDQFPFERPQTLNSEAYRDDIGAPGWNRFSAVDVLLIAVQQRLMSTIGYADGLGPETARNIVGNNGGAIADMLRASVKSDEWIGYVGQPIERGGSDGGFNVSGSVAAVFERISRRCVAEGDPTSSSLFTADSAAERIFLVNVSEVLRALRSRALAAGLQFPKEAA